ncbi:MAG: T9SS type A sorting domain-containing protein [Candidatus Kapaibacterium sp.]
MKTLFVTILLGCLTGLGLLAQTPKFEWVIPIESQLGYYFNYSPYAMTVDDAGYVYVTGGIGTVGKLDFDPGPDTTFLDWQKGNRFIAKYAPNGGFVWARNMGGNITNVTSNCIKVDASGNVYSLGEVSYSEDFDPGPSKQLLEGFSNGSGLNIPDIFLLKLDSAGNFVWVKKFGGKGNDHARSLELDEFGNAILSGTVGLAIDSMDVDPGIGTHNLWFFDGSLFIAKVNPDGELLWVQHLFANADADIYSMELDKQGNIFTAGYFNGRDTNLCDFDPGKGVYNLLDSNGSVYILKLNATGNFMWAKQLNGSTLNGKNGCLLSTDNGGNVVLLGEFERRIDVDPGGGTYYLGDTSNVFRQFLLTLDHQGNFVSAKETKNRTAIDVDANSNYYVPDSRLGGDSTMACEKFTSNGVALWSTKFDGNFKRGFTIDFAAQGNAINSIKVDKLGNVYILGRFQSTVDFDPSEKVYNLKSNGLNIFLLKLSQQPTSVEEHISSPSFSVYPNPGTTTITAAFGKEVRSASVRITDLLGQVLVSQTDVNGNSLQVDVSQFSPGMYILELSDGGIVSRVKLVKE